MRVKAYVNGVSDAFPSDVLAITRSKHTDSFVAAMAECKYKELTQLFNLETCRDIVYMPLSCKLVSFTKSTKSVGLSVKHNRTVDCIADSYVRMVIWDSLSSIAVDEGNYTLLYVEPFVSSKEDIENDIDIKFYCDNKFPILVSDELCELAKKHGLGAEVVYNEHDTIKLISENTAEYVGNLYGANANMPDRYLVGVNICCDTIKNKFEALNAYMSEALELIKHMDKEEDSDE